MNATPSPSTSLRVCSTVFGGLNPSSRLMRLIFLPDAAALVDHFDVSKFSLAHRAPG
jgi:hypothetical protein